MTRTPSRDAHVLRHDRVAGAAFILALALVTSALPQDAAAASAPSAAAPLPRFIVGGATIRTLADEQLPYNSPNVVPLPDTGPHDDAGVRIFQYNGLVFDHPVNQAQFAIQLINDYRLTGDQTYLDLAKAQADRLIDTSVTSRGAMYFPYQFDFPLFGIASDVMKAPWYSAMAQGQALSVFDRLFAITHDVRYSRAAARTFNSYLNLPAAGVPWTVFVDTAGYLWLEEYASVQPVGGRRPPPSRVLNGHIFSAFGLLDHWRATGDSRALLLLKGAIATVRRYVDDFRTPGWISCYGLRHHWQIGSYHVLHTLMLQQLYTITGDVTFAATADEFSADYVTPTIAATGRLEPGTHIGYHLAYDGGIVGSSTVDITDTTAAAVNGRTSFRKQTGMFIHFSDGPLASYWVPEAAGSAYIPGALGHQVFYDPPRAMTIPAGTQTGYQFAADGTVTAQQPFVLDADTVGATTTLAVINGARYRLFVDDIFRGYWFAETVPTDAPPTSRPSIRYPYKHRHVVLPQANQG